MIVDFSNHQFVKSEVAGVGGRDVEGLMLLRGNLSE